MWLEHHHKTHDEGYSLLEILIVLAIMGIGLSLVSSRLFTLYESAQFDAQSRNILSDIRSLRARAYLTRTHYMMTDQDVPVSYQRVWPELPEGMMLEGGPLLVTEAGYCNATRFIIRDSKGRQAIYAVGSPGCEIERIISDDVAY